MAWNRRYHIELKAKVSELDFQQLEVCVNFITNKFIDLWLIEGESILNVAYMKNKIFIRIVLIVLIVVGCNTSGKDRNDLKSNIMINKLELSYLKGKQVYFAHQSVGNNIIDGVNSLINKNKELDFIKVITLEDFLKLKIHDNDSSFYLIHSNIGINQFPELKLNDFQFKLDTLKNIDAAFLKFCYVDINPQTDINLLYTNYINKISNLEKQYSNTKFIYFTCPLSTESNYFIGLIKALFGKPDHNIRRNQFNKLIRGTSKIKKFDIAYLESHLENDSKEIKREYLLKEYASDYGHLNSFGSEKIALNLLTYLNHLFQEK